MTTKFTLKQVQICSFCSFNTWTQYLRPSAIKTLIKKEKTHTNFIKIVIETPCTLLNTLASVWLGFAIGSRTDLRSVRVTHDAKQIQSMEP